MKHTLFSKRVLGFLLSTIFLLFLCACEQRNEGSSTESLSLGSSDENASPEFSEISSEPAAPLGTSPLSAYQSVLQNNAVFFSTDANTNLYISQLNLAVSDVSATAKATKLSIVDLDNDGTPEVILRLAVNNNDYYGFEVLRYQDGVVYGYTLWYRAFMDLKADGTFSFSSGAMDSGFGTIKFTEQNYTIDEIAYSQSSYDSNSNLTVSFFINNGSTTQDEFNSALKTQDEKPDATWYDFTDNNIETVFP